MLVLFETPAGYAVFKLLDEKKLKNVDDLYKEFESPDSASKVVKLKHFHKFDDTTEALAGDHIPNNSQVDDEFGIETVAMLVEVTRKANEKCFVIVKQHGGCATTAAVEGKMGKGLKKLLKKVVAKDAHEQLAVSDAKLAGAIKDKLNINCISSSAIHELMRGIRNQMNNLVTGIQDKEMAAMALGLAHSLSRYKLKFSPDKVDTMIVQAISLLDDLDKELNNYVMRCREWFGWHFPELSKIITDNIAYAKTVKAMGTRANAANQDFSEILPEEVEEQLKAAAEISMGVEISKEDEENMMFLCDQILEIADYRAQLYDYLKNRMLAIAPNLTTLVGELVGARLIAHAGSLINLAKHPSSTVQILGAEKALFRALKTKHDTPKYGLIYHASLVGQCAPKNKGKISRMLAAKASLAIRVDALGEDSNTEMGIENKAKLEARLKMFEEGQMRKISGTGKSQAKFDKYENKSQIKTYNPDADSTIGKPKKRKHEETEVVKKEEQESEEEEEAPTKKSKKDKKKKKEKQKTETEESDEEEETAVTPKKKKKKEKKRKTEAEESDDEEEEEETAVPKDESSEKKKKKKKKKKQKTEDSD